MPRRPNPARREELEEAVASYVLRHGIADLSLRPVAEALGVSTYSLVYHFGAKEDLIAAVMARIEDQQRAMTSTWIQEAENASPSAIMRRYWAEWCLPDELAPYHRLFYEIYALALRQPERFPGFLERGALPWLESVRQLALQTGLREVDADLAAWLMTSTVVGALLVLLGTGDKDMATRTVNAAADAIDDLVRRARPGAAASQRDHTEDGHE
jgi:AcrR family transcriptional regulator